MAKFAYRLESRRVREPDFPYTTADRILSAEAAIKFALSMEDLDIEKFVVLYLDAKNKLIGIHISPGTANQASVYPREVFKHALLSGASSIVLVHNRPSGHLQPSDEDLRVTKTIMDAAKLFDVYVHDHILVANGEGMSFREEGYMAPP